MGDGDRFAQKPKCGGGGELFFDNNNHGSRRNYRPAKGVSSNLMFQSGFPFSSSKGTTQSASTDIILVQNTPFERIIIALAIDTKA